ncbi:MAG: hypothetical protein GY749_05860 [Desulfobacteraceae bacterium]|nr:hypothetical protein [Desulfobacteraceae bacterium]
MFEESLSTPNLNPALAKILEQILLPHCIIVSTDVPAGPEQRIPVLSASENGFGQDEDFRFTPYPISILLRSLEKDGWTEEQMQVLPDGIRDFYSDHTLLEFKTDDPIDESSLRLLVAETYFYHEEYKCEFDDIQWFLITRHPIPEEIINLFHYVSFREGIYHSGDLFIDRIRLIRIEELKNTPRNAPFKFFSTDGQERKEAAAALKLIDF